MKTWICLILCGLLLTGCAPSQEPASTAEAPVQTIAPAETTVPAETTQPVSLMVYAPDETAEGFVTTQVEVEAVTEAAILQALTDAQVLSQDVQINILETVADAQTPENVQLHVDFNGAFATLLQSQGTAGEYGILGSVVNTFLTAYEAQTMLVTVDGAPLETGHNVYDTALEFYE